MRHADQPPPIPTAQGGESQTVPGHHLLVQHHKPSATGIIKPATGDSGSACSSRWQWSIRKVIESVAEDEDSTMDEDNDDIATTYIAIYTSLPQDAQRSIAQALTRKLQRCAGFRPQTLHSTVDLLNHVPTAHLYASGVYHSTNLERLTGRVQLRQHNFHAVGCLEFAALGGTTCVKCRAYRVKHLEECMPHLGKPASRLPTTLNDAHLSQYQMKEKKDHLRETERTKSLMLLTMRRKVHRQERALGFHQGVRLSFCLEEVVWESKAALLKYHSTRGELKERKSKPRGKGKGAGRVGLEQGGAGAAVAVQAEEGGKGEEEEEEEEEAEGEDQGEDDGEGESGLCGKRRSDGPEAGSASKRR